MGGSFPLSATRTIQIDTGDTATIDTHTYNAVIPGVVNGTGNLTVTNTANGSRSGGSLEVGTARSAGN